MTQTIKVFEAFAGYGSQSIALSRLREDFPQFNFEVVGISEIDKNAIKAYMAIHGDTPNFGDISKINWGGQIPDFDLFTYSFPCTDISSAGLQKGLSENSGTRSSLLWECRKAIEIKRPKYLLMENVKALIQKKFMPDFRAWQDWLISQGYVNFWQVLNAKNYGVPQNRERVFMISIRNDGDNPTYNFPQPFELTKRLKDILETNVDEKYYLKQEQVDRIVDHCNRKVAEGCGFKTNFTPPKELAEQSLQNAATGKQTHLLSRPMNDGINTDADGNSRTVQANYYKQNYYNFEPTNSRNATAVIEVCNAKEND